MIFRGVGSSLLQRPAHGAAQEPTGRDSRRRTVLQKLQHEGVFICGPASIFPQHILPVTLYLLAAASVAPNLASGPNTLARTFLQVFFFLHTVQSLALRGCCLISAKKHTPAPLITCRPVLREIPLLLLHEGTISPLRSGMGGSAPPRAPHRYRPSCCTSSLQTGVMCRLSCRPARGRKIKNK